jgi:hypothetical protein
MARLYRYAHGCITRSSREEHRRGLTRMHAERFLRRSEHLYRGLIENTDMWVRHTARVELHRLGGV